MARMTQKTKENMFGAFTIDELNAKKKYVFEFYSVDGGTIYILYLDANGETFTEQGYKIDCDSLNAKLTSLIVK